MASVWADSPGRDHKGSILIVDDHEGIRELFRTILEPEYNVTEAGSGAALFEALDRGQPDVVLLDVMLPDANGLRLLPVINERWPGTQVIVLTGSPTESEQMSATIDAVNRGAFCLLSKSGDFDLQKLMAGVSSAMHRRFQGPAGSAIQPPS